MIQVHLNVTVQNIRTDNGTEFVNRPLRVYYEDVGISHQTSVAHTPQQNSVVKRQNQTLVEASRTLLIFYKALLFLWAEKPDLSYLYVFGALCYPTNDSKDLGKLKPKADIGIFVSYAPAKKVFRIYNKRTRLISNPPSPTPYVPPTIKDWDILCQLMLDEYFNPPPSVASLVPVFVAPKPDDPTCTPSSNTIDQDVPSPNELGDVLKSKATLVARGNHQEEGIDFQESFAPVA
ncbi:retrovirus-related pol polyprotein from transposon TNT 1-94 [Tanacetum coccineum]